MTGPGGGVTTLGGAGAASAYNSCSGGAERTVQSSFSIISVSLNMIVSRYYVVYANVEVNYIYPNLPLTTKLNSPK